MDAGANIQQSCCESDKIERHGGGYFAKLATGSEPMDLKASAPSIWLNCRWSRKYQGYASERRCIFVRGHSPNTNPGTSAFSDFGTSFFGTMSFMAVQMRISLHQISPVSTQVVVRCRYLLSVCGFFSLYCSVLLCTALYCSVLHCTVLYCTVLHCNCNCNCTPRTSK